MKDLQKDLFEQKMTVKEVADVLCKDESTIRKIGKSLFPDYFRNGVKTLLNEKQVTAIKLNLGKNSELAKTNFEKELIIQQAMQFQKEKIEFLQAENKELQNTVNILIHDSKTYTTTEIAKELNLKSAKQLNIILEKQNVQYKVNNSWVLTAKYSDMDYVSLKQQELDNGKIIYNRHWTGRGREFILKLIGDII